MHAIKNADYSKKWLSFIGITLLSFGAYLDYTVVNIALPTMQQTLQADLTALQWVMNIYFLALCVLATIMGRLGDLFGRRRCFYLGGGIFTIASIMAGFAPSIHWVILGRLLQGIGAAFVFPLGPSLLPDAFPEKERAKAIAWLGSMGGVALALGPVLGGMIVTYLGWRWIFFINVPIALIGYLFCFRSIKESVIQSTRMHLDWLGMILLGIAICGIVLSLIHSQTSGWRDGITLSLLITGLIASALLVFIENKQENPLIDFRDFKNILFYSGAALCFLAGTLSAVTLFFDPLYLQVIQNKSPQSSGIILFAIPIAVFIIAFFIEKLIARLNLIRTILTGILLAFLSALLHTYFSSTTSLWFITLTFLLLGCMWGIGNTVSIIAAQLATPSHRTSVATGTIVTMFNIGGSIGLAIATAIYQFATTSSLAHAVKINSIPSSSNLEKLIANPANSLQTSMSPEMHLLFNQIFIHGFAAVMWFLVVLSAALFLSIFIWHMGNHHANHSH